MLDRALYVSPVGRQHFGSVYLEIRIIEGRITEVLLYLHTPNSKHISDAVVEKDNNTSIYCIKDDFLNKDVTTWFHNLHKDAESEV